MNKSKLRGEYLIYHGDLGDLVASKDEIKSGKSLLEVGVPVWDFIDQALAKAKSELLEEVIKIIKSMPKMKTNHCDQCRASRDGYNAAIFNVLCKVKEQRQKLSLLEGKKWYQK